MSGCELSGKCSLCVPVVKNKEGPKVCAIDSFVWMLTAEDIDVLFWSFVHVLCDKQFIGFLN